MINLLLIDGVTLKTDLPCFDFTTRSLFECVNYSSLQQPGADLKLSNMILLRSGMGSPENPPAAYLPLYYQGSIIFDETTLADISKFDNYLNQLKSSPSNYLLIMVINDYRPDTLNLVWRTICYIKSRYPNDIRYLTFTNRADSVILSLYNNPNLALPYTVLPKVGDVVTPTIAPAVTPTVTVTIVPPVLPVASVVKTIKDNNDQPWPITQEQVIVLQKIYSHMRTILNALVSGQNKLINDILSPQFEGYWLASFTREDLNSNNHRNMELMEKIGDVELKQQFQDMLVQWFPTLTNADVSDLTENWLQTNVQAMVAAKFELTGLIQTQLRNKGLKMSEDALEALFGTIRTICLKLNVDSRLISRPLTEKMFGRLVKIEVDDMIKEGARGQGNKNNPINQLKEIFQRLYTKDITKELFMFNAADGVWTVKVPDKYFDMLIRDKHIDVKRFNSGQNAPTKILAIYQMPFGMLKETGKNVAAREAIAKLKSWGLTPRVAEDLQIGLQIKYLQDAGLWAGFAQALIAHNYTENYFRYRVFQDSEETSTSYLMQIISIDKISDTRVIVFSKRYDTSEGEWRLDIVKSYLESL